MKSHDVASFPSGKLMEAETITTACQTGQRESIKKTLMQTGVDPPVSTSQMFMNITNSEMQETDLMGLIN